MSISSCVYKCFISSSTLSILGNRNVNDGLYFRNPYTSQASLNEPLTTFSILLKYDLEKSYLLHIFIIKLFKVKLVIVDILYFPNSGLIYLFIRVLYASIVLYFKLVLQ